MSDKSTHSKILILDFGSQYTQVIARRIRECQVYSEIIRFDRPAAEIAAMQPKGLILSGGPASVYDKGAPQVDPGIFSLNVPILGICYGLMLMAHHLDGRVVFTGRREYGAGVLHMAKRSELFDGLGNQLDVWNSHGDEVTELPKGFRVVGTTDGCDFAAVEDPQRKLYGLQFHPEVAHRVFGENFHIKLKYVDASERFLSKLRGVTDPEEKRKIIGNEFIRVFEDAIVDLAKTDDGLPVSDHKFRFLAQGTLYPDVIESVSIEGNPAQVIKTHHNVGGLPEKMQFELVEPVRQLFKDEVRQAGLQLGLPKEIVYRQPFPGPGLAVRILGEVTPERLAILREADTIVQSEMEAAHWHYKVWQSFAVLLPVQSVGVMGDQRTYENTVVLRIVESQDGMTADWVRIPYELLARISNRICNEVKGVNRAVFDISSKPPSTIEWE